MSSVLYDDIIKYSAWVDAYLQSRPVKQVLTIEEDLLWQADKYQMITWHDADGPSIAGHYIEIKR